MNNINTTGLVQKISASRPIEGLQVVPGSQKLLVESGMRLYALPDQASTLTNLIKKIEFDKPVGFIHLPVDTENGWNVNGDNTLSTIENSDIWVTELNSQLTRRQLHLPNNNNFIMQVLLANDGQTLIAEITGGNDPDFLEHTIAKINTSEKSFQQSNNIHSIDDLLIGWASENESFIIFDTDAVSLWRWQLSSDLPQKIYHQTDSETTALMELGFGPQGRWISLLHENDENGQFHIDFLSIESGDINGRLKLPEGNWQQLQWHPTQEVVVGIREHNDQANLNVLDKKGNILAKQPIPQTWVINCMAWSEDGKSIYIGGDKWLYLWILPNHFLISK